MARTIRNPKKAKRKNKGSKKGDGSSSSSAPAMPTRVWQPGVDNLAEDEELQCDPSAYNALHAFHVGWPCLSFDIVRDTLGLVRKDFPHTAYLVAGTQADKATSNYLGVYKISNISGKRRGLLPENPTAQGSDIDTDDSDSESESEDEGTGGSGPPVLELRKIVHEGCINRIRVMPQSPHISASWADTGLVQIWDFSSHLNVLAESESEVNHGASTSFNLDPLMKYKHKDEGYALDWSPVVAGRLLSGDCHNSIHLWEPVSGTAWNVDTTPFSGHSASVEDLQEPIPEISTVTRKQIIITEAMITYDFIARNKYVLFTSTYGTWSPVEPDTFASCSVDGTIAIWDARRGKKPVHSFKAHDADVNVISWNRLASCMLASGSDDGTFSIHDLRNLKGKESTTVVAHFAYHKHPVTSIEWSPHEGSTLAVSSADNQLTIWDFALERDEEEEAEFRAMASKQVNAPQDLPPQLLFVHQGQKDIKELHWHSQIPGMIVSTALDGFNILMPSNIQNTLPSNDV